MRQARPLPGIEAGKVAQILFSGQLVVEHGRVTHIADALAGLMRLVVAEDGDLAEAGAEQAGKNAQQSGLARAVFAEKNVAAAGLKIDRNLAQRGKGAEKLRDVVQSSKSSKDGPGANSRSGGLGYGSSHCD